MPTYSVSKKQIPFREASDFVSFYQQIGYTRISSKEYDALLANPTVDDEIAAEEGKHRIRSNQTIYPGDKGFHDFGDENVLGKRDPLYRDLTWLYFKRLADYPDGEKLDGLADSFIDLQNQEDNLVWPLEQVAAKEKALMTYTALPLALGFLLFFGGGVMLILATASPEDFSSLRDSGLFLVIAGGILFVSCLCIFLFGAFRRKSKAMSASAQPKLKEIAQKKAEIAKQIAFSSPQASGKAVNVTFQVAPK